MWYYDEYENCEISEQPTRWPDESEEDFRDRCRSKNPFSD